MHIPDTINMLGLRFQEENDITSIILTVAICLRISASYLESPCLYAKADCPCVGLFSFGTATIGRR